MKTPSDLLGVFCDIDDTLTVEDALFEVLSVMAEAQAEDSTSCPLRAVRVDGSTTLRAAGQWTGRGREWWPLVLARRPEAPASFLSRSPDAALNRQRLTDLGRIILAEVEGSVRQATSRTELDLAVDFAKRPTVSRRRD